MTQPLLIAYALPGTFVISWHLTGVRQGRTVATPHRRRERLFSLFIVLGWALILILPGKPMTPKLWTAPSSVD